MSTGDAKSEGSLRGEEWSSWQSRLRAADFHPSRRLGQNFLLDTNLLEAIARDAAVGRGDHVIEVGTGLGFLTRALVATGAMVTSIEVDRRLHELVSEDLGALEGLTLIRADALQGKHSLSPELCAAIPAADPWHLVGNLPYSVSGPLLAECAQFERPPESMTVLIQKEMALRAVAGVGEPGWGLLGMRLQMAYEVRQLRTLGGAHFRPRPKVESSLIRLQRREDAPPREVQAAVVGLSNALFTRRKQVVRRVLSDVMGDRGAALAALSEAGVPEETRVEGLKEADWVALAASTGWPSQDRDQE